MEVVDKSKIQEYAKRNTSPKMPIEAKYVEAFLDSLMNSSKIQDAYTILRDEMQNGDAFVIYNSFFPTAVNLNREPYRSIIAYSMLKKDKRLFELISSSLFTGSVIEYHGTDLYTDISHYTDETPLRETDHGIYTDMQSGIIQMAFKNYYCNDPLPDGTGSEYQTTEEIEKADSDFTYIITLTKPARIQVLEFYVPWCFMTGTVDTLQTCGIDITDPYFSTPFKDEMSMNILSNMNTSELITCYRVVSMIIYHYEEGEYVSTDRPIDVEREVTITDSYVLFDYNLRTLASSSSSSSTEKDLIWGEITFKSNAGGEIYATADTYKPEEKYFEKYTPIMLRLFDNDPDGPCIAFEIQNDVCTKGAMFYLMEAAD
jgi:hypothetical protein